MSAVLEIERGLRRAGAIGLRKLRVICDCGVPTSKGWGKTAGGSEQEVGGVKIISFGYTWAAVVAGAKKVTRREWDEDYARSFCEGEVLQGWDRSPRFHGRRIADVRLTAQPYLEPVCQIPDEDYELEGFGFLYRNPSLRSKTIFGRPVTDATFARSGLGSFFEEWRRCDPTERWWVVRFEPVEIYVENPLPAGASLPLFTL